MLVEVPTRVTSPPSSEANDIGINRRETEVPVRRESCCATGISIASAPTFLVDIESSAVAAAITGTWLRSVFSRSSSGRSAASTTPLRWKAALTTSAEAMITTTSLLKPSKAWSAGTTPIRTPVSTEPSATTS